MIFSPGNSCIIRRGWVLILLMNEKIDSPQAAGRVVFILFIGCAYILFG